MKCLVLDFRNSKSKPQSQFPKKDFFLFAILLISALGFLEYVYQVSGRIRSIIRIANKKQNFPSMIPVAIETTRQVYTSPLIIESIKHVYYHFQRQSVYCR